MAVIDVLAQLTAPMHAVLDKQRELAGDAFATGVGFAQMRANYLSERRFWNEGGPVMAQTTDSVIVGPGGPVPIRVHRPSPEARTCIVFVHGGGFVVGSVQTHDRVMRTLAAATGAVVVGVDYTLSPEAKFPQAIHETAAAVRQVREHAGTWGIDPAHISLAGDSGGAMLALASTLYLRDQGDAGVESLLLYYGMFGLTDSPSRRLLGGAWDGLTRADLAYYVDCYTSGPADLESPYLDLLSANLCDLPPCYVAAVRLDPLLDDSTTLVAMLEAQGIPHRLRVFDGVLHAFLHYSRMLPEAGEALSDGADFYRSVLAFRTS